MLFAPKIPQSTNSFVNLSQTKSRVYKNDFIVIFHFQISYLDKTAHSMDKMLTRAFTRWGTFIASYPVAVLIITVCLGIVASCGLFKMVIITDPVELWSAPGSRARLEKEYFDETFVPFYRTEQVLIMAPNKESHIYETYLEGNQTFGPVIDIDILSEVREYIYYMHCRLHIF